MDRMTDKQYDALMASEMESRGRLASLLERVNSLVKQYADEAHRHQGHVQAIKEQEVWR